MNTLSEGRLRAVLIVFVVLFLGLAVVYAGQSL